MTNIIIYNDQYYLDFIICMDGVLSMQEVKHTLKWNNPKQVNTLHIHQKSERFNRSHFYYQ